MNPIIQWDPFRELEKLGTWFGRSMTPSTGNGGETLKLAEWTPLVDISEDEKEYLVKSELPEIKKEDVKVSVEDGVLSIKGERRFEKEEKKRKYHRVERGYGSFIRRFTLPDDASASKVSAEFKDGVLTVHLPKTEQKKIAGSEIKIEG